jgi:signal transduction histidine kinase
MLFSLAYLKLNAFWGETLSIQNSTDEERPDREVATLKQEARELARTVDALRLETLNKSNERIEMLEQKARDMAWFVETTRQQTLLQSDKKIESLEQKARDLADFVETLTNQTRVQSETEIEALGQKARDMALFVEKVRKETRVRFETEIALLGQRARDLAASTEFVREKAQLESDTEIASLSRRARDLAVSVETVVEAAREETLQESHAEIEGLKQDARNLAVSVEKSRIDTLLESDKVTRKLNEELEQRVLERTEQLEEANKELEAFSYSVSHDLRAPLRAIGGFSRILLEEYAAPLPPEAKEYLKLVCENTSQMGHLVDDLLSFSRLGRLALTKKPVNPETIVRLCLQEMQPDLLGRQIEIVIGTLPLCQADPTLLKQVWTNLISNALKYTRKRELGRVEIGSRTGPQPLANEHKNLTESKEETVYFVKDNGAGYDMKYADKLFGVFQRQHRATDYEGTGVGLAIVQRIISRHGGRVWGEAEVNKGATFSFTLENARNDT